MSWWIAGAAVVSAIYGEDRRQSSVKKARKRQKQDQLEAKRAEVFSETEGEGIGNIGRVSLNLDTKVDKRAKKTGTGLRI